LNFSVLNQMKANGRLPKHVAVIMDGNGRWAKKRAWLRIRGHEKGVDTVRTVVETSREVGIAYLTLYAFSTENWQRPEAEVHALMTLLTRFLKSEAANLNKNEIRLNAIGQIDRLPPKVRSVLADTMAQTAKHQKMTLNLALSYGARDELTRAIRKAAQKIADGELTAIDISEEIISQHLDTAGMPDPDLMIRTSGEMRISNFLLWQIAYAELFITPTLWPDFSREEYLKILENYGNRERRFGKTSR